MKDALAKGSIISWATMSCTVNLWLFYGQILHCTVYCTCCNRPDLQSFKMVVGWRGCPPTLCLSTVSLALKECEAASAADVTVTVVIGFLSNPCHLYRETLKRALCFSFICPVKKKKKIHLRQKFIAVVFLDECSQSELPLQSNMQNRAKTERQTVNKFHFLSACLELNITVHQGCPSALSQWSARTQASCLMGVFCL